MAPCLMQLRPPCVCHQRGAGHPQVMHVCAADAWFTQLLLTQLGWMAAPLGECLLVDMWGVLGGFAQRLQCQRKPKMVIVVADRPQTAVRVMKEDALLVSKAFKLQMGTETRYQAGIGTI